MFIPKKMITKGEEGELLILEIFLFFFILNTENVRIHPKTIIHRRVT